MIVLQSYISNIVLNKSHIFSIIFLYHLKAFTNHQLHFEWVILLCLHPDGFIGKNNIVQQM
jgi:hypothetical protein